MLCVPVEALIVPENVVVPFTVRLPPTVKFSFASLAYCALWARKANGAVRSSCRGMISVGEEMTA